MGQTRLHYYSMDSSLVRLHKRLWWAADPEPLEVNPSSVGALEVETHMVLIGFILFLPRTERPYKVIPFTPFVIYWTDQLTNQHRCNKDRATQGIFTYSVFDKNSATSSRRGRACLPPGWSNILAKSRGSPIASSLRLSAYSKARRSSTCILPCSKRSSCSLQWCPNKG